MTTTNMIRRTLLSSTVSFAVALFSSSAAFGAARGQVVPDQVPVSPNLKAALMRGDFTTKIMPRKGYMGPLLFGNLRGAKLVEQAGKVPPPGGGHLFFPATLGYYGGPLVSNASHINTYWGESNSSTWGYPDTYQYYLNYSNMIEMLNYYVGNTITTNNHFPPANIYWYGGGPGSLVYQSQIASLVQGEATYDRANRGASLNYSNIYHVFLPPGTDTCFDNAANGCYNPDGHAPGPFAFCGYHSYTQLGDGTVVLYTVEPYQSVGGCSTGTGLSNDTANVLGHEIAETITDPIPGYGWVGEFTLGRGQEIGDECAWTIYGHNLAGVTYYTQDWYSNVHRGCDDVH